MCPECACRSCANQALRLCPTSVWNRRHYYVVRYRNACDSRQKLGTAAVLDVSISCSFVSQTLNTWSRYFRPFRMQGFFEADWLRDYVLKLNADSLQLRRIECCVHTSRKKVAATKFRFTLQQGLQLWQGPGRFGGAVCEVCHDCNKQCNYCPNEIHIFFHNKFGIRFPWGLQMTWSVVKALRLRKTILGLAPHFLQHLWWYRSVVMFLEALSELLAFLSIFLISANPIVEFFFFSR